MDSKRQRGAAASKQAVEAGGERVFVTHPRMFSFTHRAQGSLRHPHVPLAVQQTDAEIAKARKQWQTRSERLSDVLADGGANQAAEEERWRVVGRMLDAMLFEPDIAARRQHALDNAALRRALETWWCKAGGTPTRGVVENEYRRIHEVLYGELLRSRDACLQSVVGRAIQLDWAWDSNGAGEVSFGRWYISLLEVADNWVPSCDGEAYGAFLAGLLEKVFAAPERGPTAAPVVEDAASWESTCAFLQRNARTFTNPPLIRVDRTIRHTVEYRKVQ